MSCPLALASSRPFQWCAFTAQPPSTVKAMISTGERISIETDDLGGRSDSADTTLARLRALPFVTNADYDGHELTVNCRQGDHNLIDVLQLLEHEGTNIGHLSSRQPTLNDVFLELTGTALRD